MWGDIMLLIEYPKCSTCKSAKKWLEENDISFIDRNIVDDVPTIEELETWISKFNIPCSKIFNTSGIKYRELGLKDKLKSMSDEDKLKLLAEDGMLIKRPLVITDDKMLVGFKIKEWEEYFK